MLLRAIRFHNYRAFRDAELPLTPLTLLIGPNGAGKTSALSAIEFIGATTRDQLPDADALLPIGLHSQSATPPELEVIWENGLSASISCTRELFHSPSRSILGIDNELDRLGSSRLFTLEATQIGNPVPLTNTLELQGNGGGLPAVLTTLQDKWPERFEALNVDLRKWLPEFNRILFDTPRQGQRAIALRSTVGNHSVPTSKLSAGTLLSLALLSLTHLPTSPAIIGLEEPDHGIHPRLMRDLKESLNRLTDPASFGDTREPVQVIVTTHSPYFVDLFKDELESVVIVQKEGLYSNFTRLIDLPNVTEILKDAALGDAWYSGILGGVPVEA